MKRLLGIAAILCAVFTALFFIADHYGWMEPAFVEAKLRVVRGSPHGRLLAAGAVIGLLAVDLILPVPSSVVMTASGALLGGWTGGCASFAGAMIAALGGFYLCRFGGQAAFRRMTGGADLAGVDAWFRRWGVLAIVLSRPAPMLTEILSCLAGLSGLPAPTFALAAALGTLPVCFVYSYAGSWGGVENPWPAVLVAIGIPAAGWALARWIRGARGKETP